MLVFGNGFKLTTKGKQMVSSGASYSFSKIVLGAGTYTSAEDATTRTALKSQKQSFDVSNTSVDGTTVTIAGVITNASLAEGYTITEAGVIAKDSTGAEHLFLIGVATLSDPMPAHNDNIPDVICDMKIKYTTSNTSKVSLSVPETAFARALDLKDVKSQLAQTANDIVTNYAKKNEVTNIMTPKGNLTYASLPTTGNTIGWYYYCPDGDGINGSGNYAWNGTNWYFAGNGDAGYSRIKQDLTEGNVGNKSLIRVKTNWYKIEDTNIIGEENGYPLIIGYYYSPSAGFIARSGYSCHYMVEIEPSTTYYVACTSLVLFNSNKEKTSNYDLNLAGGSFTSGVNDKYVCINYNGIPTAPQGYYLSKKNGTQVRKIFDNDLSIVDKNFNEYEMNYGKLLKKNKMKCKMIEDYLSIEYFNKNITKTNVEVHKWYDKKFSSESVRCIATNNGTCKITKTLDRPIKLAEFESITTVIYVPYETLNTESETGAYVKIALNGAINTESFFNGRVHFGWNVLKLDKDEFKNLSSDITSISYTINPRNNVQTGATFGTVVFDSIIFNMRMKPTILISFDQIWQESIDNTAYERMYNRNIPFTMYTIYDGLNSNQKAMIEKYKNFAEFSLYATIEGKNGVLWDDITYPNVDSKLNYLNQGLNAGETIIKKPFKTYALSQTLISPMGYTALCRTNLQLARTISDSIPIGYFDNTNRLFTSTSIDQKTSEFANAIIDRAIKYGSIASLFLHGVRNDSNDSTSISGKGMNLTEFTKMLNYIQQLQNAGTVQVMTYEQFVNACIGNYIV